MPSSTIYKGLRVQPADFKRLQISEINRRDLEELTEGHESHRLKFRKERFLEQAFQAMH